MIPASELEFVGWGVFLVWLLVIVALAWAVWRDAVDTPDEECLWPAGEVFQHRPPHSGPCPLNHVHTSRPYCNFCGWGKPE